MAISSNQKKSLVGGLVALTALFLFTLMLAAVLILAFYEVGPSKDKNPSPPARPANRRVDPNDPLRNLPIAWVHVPWETHPVQMRVLMFYKKGVFGEQFSNLHPVSVEVDTRWRIPTPDGTVQTLMNYEKNKGGPKMVKFKSSEHVFQSAKAKWRSDAEFIQDLDSPRAAADAGQGKLIMDNAKKQRYAALNRGRPAQLQGNTLKYQRRDNWERYKQDVMLHVLRRKFGQHPQLIQEYVGGAMPVLFVEHTAHDDKWGDNDDGAGLNQLGKLLTALAYEMKAQKTLTLDNEMRRWLHTRNDQVIQDGKKWYKENGKCPWLIW